MSLVQKDVCERHLFLLARNDVNFNGLAKLSNLFAVAALAIFANGVIDFFLATAVVTAAYLSLAVSFFYGTYELDGKISMPMFMHFLTKVAVYCVKAVLCLFVLAIATEQIVFTDKTGALTLSVIGIGIVMMFEYFAGVPNYLDSKGE